MSDKIITTLQQRLNLERAIANLGKTTTEADLDGQAQALVAAYPQAAILDVLIENLDTANGQMRGGLGKIAALLSPKEAVGALVGVAANRRHSAQSRLTAALLLQRFLGQEVIPAWLADLHGSDQVVLQSLQEAVEEGRTNRYVLLEYVRQMRQEPEAVAYMVMGLFPQIAPPDQVGLLRLLVQDDRPGVAQAALQRLGQIQEGEAASLALAALHGLPPNLPPALAEAAAQAARRLRFAGIRMEMHQSPGWRALLGPADPSGSQTIWFVRRPGQEDDHDGVLIRVHINPVIGVVEAFGHERLDASVLPAHREPGQLITVASHGPHSLVMLEAPFDFARWRLQAALSAHWQATPLRPLPEEYRLYNDLLWTLPPPSVPAALQTFFTPNPQVWADARGNLNLGTAADRVLQHPAMGAWFFHGQPLLRYLGSRADLERSPGVAQMVKGLLHEFFDQGANGALLVGLEAGLRAQAAWLHLSGSRDSAHQAQVLAESLTQLPPTQNPFLARMMEIGVGLALKWLAA